MNPNDSSFLTPYKNTIKKKKIKMKKNALEEVDIEEEKRKDPKYKTELCKTFMENNFCQYGNKCRFAHGEDELVIKAKINNYKRKLCKSFFNEGFCPYGIRCNFQHDQRKLSDIKLPFYYINLFIFRKPKLVSGKRLKVFEEITNTENFLSESTICSSVDNSPNQKKEDNYKEFNIGKNFSEFSPYENYKKNNININRNNLFNNKNYKTEDEMKNENNNKIISDEEKFKLGNNIYNFIFKDINEFQISNNKTGE